MLGKPEEVYRWSIRRLQAERDLSPQVADRRAALESHLKRMIELDKMIGRLNKELVPDTEKNESEWYVLEARRWIEESKAK